jgi:hypothetical protein
MRPCVKDALDNGVEDEQSFSKMRHAIIFELKRIGFEKPAIKRELMEWNKKCRPRLSEGDAKRQLCGYVDWFYKKECKLSCKGLQDYCTRVDTCVFMRTQKNNSYELPFSVADARLFLEHNYAPEGHLMGLILQTMIRMKVKKKAQNILFVGLREIRDSLLDKENCNSNEMTISRYLYKLEKIGFFKITKGKRGSFSRKSNAYEFNSWELPT